MGNRVWAYPGTARRLYRAAGAGTVLAVVGGLVAGGGAARAQTLQDALAAAYNTNPTLLAERARLRATDEGVAQALSGWRPTVEISGDVGKAHNKSEGGTTPTTSGTRSSNTSPRGAELSLSQPLYRGGRTVASVRQAEALVEADRARLLGTESSVLLDAATAYMDVVRDQAVLELNVNNERVLQRQLEATRDRFEVGELTRTDVSQAESRLANARAARIRAEGTLASSRAVFANVVGIQPERLQDVQPLEGLPTSLNDAIKLASEKDFTVLQAIFTEKAAQQQIDVVFGELLPEVSLSGSVSERRDSSPGLTNQSQSVGVRVTVPLYEAGSVSARVRSAKHTAAQRRQERDQALRDAIQTATRSWEALQSTRSERTALAAEVQAATIALQGVQQEAQVGSRTVLDVLDAEQELLTAKVNLVGAQRNEVVSTFELRDAIGALTARALDLPVEYYDFEAHYRAVRNRWWGTGVSSE